MKVYVSFDGDHIGRLVGRASLADDVEGISKISQSIDRGNSIWRSWAEQHGKVINVGGDEGRLEVESDCLNDISKIMEQYEEVTGSTVSVGIGMKLSQADKSLMAAKLKGGNRIQLYTEEVDELLASAEQKDEKQKLEEEYLKSEGLSKAEEKKDYEEHFHRLAGQKPQKSDEQQPGAQQQGANADDIKASVVKILQNVRGHSKELEQMAQTNPELYSNVKDIVNAMITMARAFKKSEELEKDLMPGGKGDDLPDDKFDKEQLEVGVKREMAEHGLDEARAKEVAKDHLTENPDYYRVEKAALEAGKTGRHNVILPVGSQVDPGPSANHEGGEIKVKDPETGKTKWRSVRAGIVMAPDGTPTSSCNPSGA